MPNAVLAIDAGTTTARAFVVGDDAAVRATARATFPIDYPAPGLVEQDPEEIWRICLDVVTEALKSAGCTASDIAAVGITTQRSCVIIWERATGRPVSPIVSWQDLRGAERATELQSQGYMVQAQSAGAKLEATLDAIENGRGRMRAGELVWGNVDTYLAFRLSAGASHIMDPSQACTTGYYDFITGQWSAPLIEAQGLDLQFFPTMKDSVGELGLTSKSVFGAEVSIGAMIGDQQCAALAQACTSPGQGKVTYGTSGTCDVNTGPDIMGTAGTYPLVLYRRGDTTIHCVEGMVITAGAVFDWLVEGVGMLRAPSDAEAVAGTVEDTQGVFCLPALVGLGSPHGQPERHGLIGGLTRGATKAHIVRAMIEGVGFRVREMLDGIYAGSPLEIPPHLLADGGASANDLLMQIQANIVGRPVSRMDPIEATAYGAATLAGQACGMWNEDGLSSQRKTDRLFEPQWSEDERESRFAEWKRNCGL